MARVSVNLDSIENTLKIMTGERDELEQTLTSSKNDIDESKTYYDTPSGDYFREKVDEYSDKELLFLKNNLKTSIEVLEQVLELYKEELENEAKLIKDMSGGIL